MAVEDSNEKRRRELEEILELRRSFGTLGRRLVNRQAPTRTGLGPTLVPLSPKPDEENPDAGEREHESPELELDQDPDQQPEQPREPAPDEGPDQDHQERPPAPERAREPQDQEPEPGQEEEGEQPEAHRDREPAPVSTTVRRMTPVVDESYRAQAAAEQAASRPFQIPEPPAARRRPWPLVAGLVAVIAVVFALGMAAGRAVLEPSPRSAPPASLQAAPVPSTPLSSAAPVRPQVSVPVSCLTTARRADVLIDLLVKKERGIEVTRALKEYTVASQTCRKEASTR